MANSKYVIITFTLLIITIKGYAQSPKESFSSKLYFPFSIGYLNSPKNNLEPGIIVKMAMEYRFHSTDGMFLRLNYDNRSNSYKKDEIQGTNIIQGKIKFNDYLGGIGYRISGKRKLRQFGLLQGGLSSCVYQNVATSQDNFIMKDKAKTIPIIKLTTGAEYYIGKSAALTFELDYIWHLKDTPFGQNHMNEGAFGISIGLTTTLF
nr:hypothetical protein [uncultured Bacteroides sp.]